MLKHWSLFELILKKTIRQILYNSIRKWVQYLSSWLKCLWCRLQELYAKTYWRKVESNLVHIIQILWWFMESSDLNEVLYGRNGPFINVFELYSIDHVYRIMNYRRTKLHFHKIWMDNDIHDGNINYDCNLSVKERLQVEYSLIAAWNKNYKTMSAHMKQVYKRLLHDFCTQV